MKLFRSPAERRALLWCLGVGLLAVALGVLEGVASRPIWVVLWSTRLDFWLGAAIVALDAVLVVAGGRGPRPIAIVSLSVFGGLLAAACGMMVVCLLIALIAEDWWGRRTMLLVEVCLGLMGAVQWFSFRAVAARR